MQCELPQAELGPAFVDYIRRLCRERVKVLCYLGIVLVSLPKSLFYYFLALRLGTAAFLLLALWMLRRPIGERWPSIFGMLTAVAVGGSISLMTRYLGGYESSYYAGLNLVFLSVSLIA